MSAKKQPGRRARDEPAPVIVYDEWQVRVVGPKGTSDEQVTWLRILLDSLLKALAGFAVRVLDGKPSVRVEIDR